MNRNQLAITSQFQGIWPFVLIKNCQQWPQLTAGGIQGGTGNWW